MSPSQCPKADCRDPWDEGCVGALNEGAKPFSDPGRPGRRDRSGLEWWACDPYPTWYRWANGVLETRSSGTRLAWRGDEPERIEAAEWVDSDD